MSNVEEAELVTKLYLYGTGDVPQDLTDPDLIRAANAHSAEDLVVNVQAYMTTGAGRFANPASFDLVNLFFADTGLEVGRVYTKEQLANRYGLTYCGNILSQWNNTDSGSDYATRTYIFNTGEFKIKDGAAFTVDAGKNHVIDNFAIEPVGYTDNFDFTGGFGTAIPNSYLEDWVDPSGIGRQVTITFDGTLGLQHYTQTQYDTHQGVFDAFGSAHPGDLYDGISDLTQHLWDVGITKFMVDEKPIFYGTAGDDIVIGDPSLNSLQEEFRENGIVYVGGQGNDTIVATATDDVFVAKYGSDFFDGGTGYDTVSYVHEDVGVAATYGYDEIGHQWEVSVAESTSEQDRLVNSEKFLLTDFDDTVSVAAAMLDDDWNPVRGPSAYFSGGLGDDSFSADLTNGSQPVVFDGGNGADTFSIAGGWDSNGGEAPDGGYTPLVIVGGEGVDTYDLTGSMSLVFLQMSDTERLDEIDLAQIGNQFASGRGNASTVVIVNPEQSDVLKWNGTVLGNVTTTAYHLTTVGEGYEIVENVVWDGEYNASWGTVMPVVVGTKLSQSDVDQTQFGFEQGNISFGAFTGRGIGEYGTEAPGTFFRATDFATYDSLVFTNFVNGDAGLSFSEYTGNAMDTITTRQWENDYQVSDGDPIPGYYLDELLRLDDDWNPYYLAHNPNLANFDYLGETTEVHASWQDFDPRFSSATLRPDLDSLLV